MDNRRDGVHTLSNSVMAIAGRGFVLSLFAGQINGVSHRACDAAVLWRGQAPATPSRSLRRAVATAWTSGARREAAAPNPNPFAPLPGWAASGDGTAGLWVGFHKERGVIRVDGQDYPVRTDDQTTLLLVATQTDGRVTVTSHALRIAAFPILRLPSLRSALLAPAWAAWRRRASPPDPLEQWLQGITGDPGVGAFLASRADPGAS